MGDVPDYRLTGEVDRLRGLIYSSASGWQEALELFKLLAPQERVDYSKLSPLHLREIIRLGKLEWLSAHRELMARSGITALEHWPDRSLPVQPSELPNRQLKELIVEEGPGWQNAYRELLSVRFGGDVFDVARRYDLTPLGIGLDHRTDPSNDEARTNESAEITVWLIEHLRGSDGRWKRLHKWDPDAAGARTFLRTMVRNMIMDLFRAEGRVPEISIHTVVVGPDGDEVEIGETYPSSEPSPDNALISNEDDEARAMLLHRRKSLLSQALEILKERERYQYLALWLFYWEGWTDKQIAAHLKQLGKEKGRPFDLRRAGMQNLLKYIAEFAAESLEGAPS